MRGVNVDGDRLRSARVLRGLTQEGLAAQADVDVKTVRKAERGGRVDVGTLSVLSAALNVGVGSLVPSDDVEAPALRQVVDRWVAAWDAQDADALLDLYRDDSVMYLPGGPSIPYGGTYRGKAAIRQAHETAWATTRTAPVRPGDYVLTASAGTVVLQGPKGVYLPDGAVMSFWCVQVFLIDSGSIIEHRVEFDTLTYSQVLGLSSA